jgi:hypothetical protein
LAPSSPRENTQSVSQALKLDRPSTPRRRAGRAASLGSCRRRLWRPQPTAHDNSRLEFGVPNLSSPKF